MQKNLIRMNPSRLLKYPPAESPVSGAASTIETLLPTDTNARR